MDGSAPIPLVEGERVTMRVFSGIHVCSFACTVERVFGRPLLYAHISFPRTIQGTSLRTAIRVKVDIPAKIMPIGAAVAGTDCLLTNLSVNGARIESKKSLPQDEDEIDLEFSLLTPHNHQEVRVRARAVATSTPPHGAFRGFGAPQSLFALERHMNVVADALAMPPDEFRRRNFIREGQTSAVGQVMREPVDMDQSGVGIDRHRCAGAGSATAGRHRGDHECHSKHDDGPPATGWLWAMRASSGMDKDRLASEHPSTSHAVIISQEG